MDKAEAGRPRRPYHHGDLKRALIAVAEELLVEGGIERFTLRECARRAGVSHAAPAHHFGDVTGLLTEVAAVGFERLAGNTLAANSAATGSPAERLRAIMLAYVETAMAHPAAFRLMFASDRVDFSQERIRTAGAAAYDVLVETVQSAVAAAGRPPPGRYSPEVTLAWSVAHGFASLLVEHRLDRGTAVAHGGDWRARFDAIASLFVEPLFPASSRSEDDPPADH